MISTGDIHRPEREITQEFLATVGSWISATKEVFVVLRYLRAAGAKDYAFIKSPQEFQKVIDSVADGTDIIAFRDPQLPIRGRVTDDFVRETVQKIPDGTEYMFVRMRPEKEGDLRLFGEMGDSHGQLQEDLLEEIGEDVAVGVCPRFIDGDNDRMISRSKGGIDGPR